MKYIILTKNKKTIVDNNIFNLVSGKKWYASYSRGLYYAAREENNKMIKLHRLIMNAKPNQIVDHINGNTLDNRLCNLRLTDRSGNAINANKRKNTTSKYKGVYKKVLKKSIKYRSQIQFNGEKIHLGSFDLEIDAAKAYNKKAKELFGNMAKLNVIGEK
jgi:hypothetical protein